MASRTVIDSSTTSNATRSRTETSRQPIYTIHTDVQTAWRRKLCNLQLVPGFFTDREKALATLATVRRTNPRAFIKTRMAHTSGGRG